MMKTLRETSWYVRGALLLVVVWAVWLFAWVVWAMAIPELNRPAANDEVSFVYTLMAVMAYSVVAAGLFAAIRLPGWGAIGGGLGVTLLALWGSRYAVDGLRHWGELHADILERGSSWVPFDDLAGLPFFVLLPAWCPAGGGWHRPRASPSARHDTPRGRGHLSACLDVSAPGSRSRSRSGSARARTERAAGGSVEKPRAAEQLAAGAWLDPPEVLTQRLFMGTHLRPVLRFKT